MRWKRKEKDPHRWKRYFCLIPRTVDGERVWLEYIERRWVEGRILGPPARPFGVLNIYQYRNKQ